MRVGKRSWTTHFGIVTVITVAGAAVVSCSDDAREGNSPGNLNGSDAEPGTGGSTSTGGRTGTGGRGTGGMSTGGSDASAGGDAEVPDASAGGSSGATGGTSGSGGALGTGGTTATGGVSQNSGGAGGGAGDAGTGEPICGHRNEACCAGNACVELNTTCANSSCFSCGGSFASLCCASGAGTTCRNTSLTCAGTGCTCYDDCVSIGTQTTVLRSDGSVWGQRPGSLPSALRIGGQVVTGFTRLRAGLGKTATTVFACGMISGGAACWGDVTGFGGLGDGVTEASAGPVTVRTAVSGPLLQIVTDLAVGNAAACAVSGGNVFCWGSNASGMLGAGSVTSGSMYAVQVVTSTGPLGGVTQVSLGGLHGCAVTTAGKVYCWGSNSNGQLGRVGADSPIAVEVLGLPSMATQVVAGVSGTAVRMSDGTAWSWGSGSCQASGTAPAQVMKGATALTGVAEALIEASSGTMYFRPSDGTSPVYGCKGSAPSSTIADRANTPVTDFYRLTGPGSYADLCAIREDGTLWVAYGTPLTEIEGPPCP